VTRVRPGAPRPGGGGYRPRGSDRRSNAEYEGRYSPPYHHQSPSSSRGAYHRSRSLEPYGRAVERSGWWSDSREPWGRPRQGRYEENGPPQYPEEQYSYEVYDMHESRSRAHPTQRSSPRPPGMSKRGMKVETTMEAPMKRPI
jgi:hypothetical protein